MSSLRVFRHGLLVGFRDFGTFWNSWKMWLLTWILRISTSAAMWVLLGRLLGSEERVHYLLIGQAVMVGPQAAGWVAAASTWDRFAGTYPLLVIAPSSLAPAMMGRTSVWFLNGVGTSLSTFAILVPLFGLPISMPRGLLVPFLVVLVCASFYSLALFLGSLVIRAPRLRNVVHNVAAILTMAICGVTVPLSFWPDWVGTVAGFLPVTHGLHSIRLLLSGGPGPEILKGVVLELFVGLFWLAAGLLTMDRMANAGRRDGSIEFT